ncbi:MAG: hypothetical protein HOP10_10910 [Chitinophagaceae bacterium]|nr:hypothetical protein [Chitinophagaceae bacterium]
MLREFFISAIIVFSLQSSHAQFDTVFAKTNIRICADSMTTGFKTKNWDLYTRYVYPAMIGSMGGKAEMIKFLDNNFASVPATAWKEYKPGKILQVIKTAGDLQAVLELRSILEWQGQRIITTTHMIGESWDGGLFWTFFDSEGDVNTAKMIKPDLSDQLVIPAKTEKAEPLSSPAQKTKNN